ncbi:TPA: aminotransferase class IV [Candidatus Gracilibacteria bacterium]|nr:aminotransferase class IV [Candidatus Gracilibacteria bacterium]
MKFGYINGEIKAIHDIQINPYDLGFLRGFAVCSVLRTTDSGKIFILQEQYDRVNNGAKAIGCDLGMSIKTFEKIIYTIIEKSNMTNAIIRIIVSGGVNNDGTTVKGPSTVLIMAENYIKIPKEKYEKGVNVTFVEFRREYPEIKTTNYLKALQHQELKNEKNAIEIIYTKNEEVFEGSMSNIFIIKNNIIITPENGCLPGTTRGLVLRLIEENNFTLEKRSITKTELLDSDEAFLTAANKNILPIFSVNDIQIGKANPITKQLMQIRDDFELNY